MTDAEDSLNRRRGLEGLWERVAWAVRSCLGKVSLRRGPESRRRAHPSGEKPVLVEGLWAEWVAEGESQEVRTVWSRGMTQYNLFTDSLWPSP